MGDAVALDRLDAQGDQLVEGETAVVEPAEAEEVAQAKLERHAPGDHGGVVGAALDHAVLVHDGVVVTHRAKAHAKVAHDRQPIGRDHAQTQVKGGVDEKSFDVRVDTDVDGRLPGKDVDARGKAEHQMVLRLMEFELHTHHAAVGTVADVGGESAEHREGFLCAGELVRRDARGSGEKRDCENRQHTNDPFHDSPPSSKLGCCCHLSCQRLVPANRASRVANLPKEHNCIRITWFCQGVKRWKSLLRNKKKLSLNLIPVSKSN